MNFSFFPKPIKNECVQVVVRCRPMSKQELAGNEYQQVVDAYPLRGVIEIRNPNESNRDNHKMFTYDAVYDKRSVRLSKHNRQYLTVFISAPHNKIYTTKSFDRWSHPFWKALIVASLPTVKQAPVKRSQWKVIVLTIS